MAVMNDPLGTLDCGVEGCGKCDTCRYLEFLEHAAAVGIQAVREPNMEAYLKVMGYDG